VGKTRSRQAVISKMREVRKMTQTTPPKISVDNRWSKNTPGDESFLVLLGERRKELLNQLQALPSGFKLWQALPLDFSVPIPVSGRCSDKQSSHI